MTTTSKLALELLQNNAANQTLANTTFAQLNQLVQADVVDKDLATPPGSPADEALYIVASSPTGSWAGQSGKLAYWLTSTGAWQFITPREGMLVHVNDENQYYKYDGSAWILFSAAFSGGSLTTALDEAPAVTLASAATVNIGAAASNTIFISGTTTITSFGTKAASAVRRLVFQGSLTVTHNSTSLILPNSSNILTSAGDVLIMVSLGSGNWRFIDYQRGAGFDSVPLTTRVSLRFDGGNPSFDLRNNSLSMPDFSGVGLNPALDTGTVGRLSSASLVTGGIAYNGFTASGANASALTFVGYHGTTTPTAATISFLAFKHNGTTGRQNLANSEIAAQFSNGTTAILQALGDGTWRPFADNTQPLGGASNRWSVVYAGTGTINTSDADEKTEVSPFSSGEIEAAKLLSKEIGTFKWLNSIQEKGADARTHIGLTVQRAIEIMQQNGLDPMSYGFICYDEWNDEFIDHPAEYEKIAVKDEYGEVIKYIDGELINEPRREQIKWAGHRYGFRMDQLNLFIARGFHERLSILESL